MGRRRSKVLALQMKLQRLHRSAMKAKMKPPFICPWCWQEKLILIYPKNKLYLFIYCSECDKGEIMPRQGMCRAIDYYCYLIDHLCGETHTFKFQRLEKKVFEDLKNKVTAGHIEVAILREE